MKKTVLLGSFLVFLFALSSTVVSAASDWEVDGAHSSVNFSVKHIFSKVNGHFDDFSADIVFDENNAAGGSFTFEIKTASVNTNIAKRDKHLQSADFFDAAKFPVISFVSEKISSGPDGMLEITGKLTVKEKVYDFVLPLKFEGRKDHPAMKGKEVAGFNGRVTVDRLDIGVGGGKFFEMGLVDRTVDVFVTLEVLRTK